MSMFENYAEVTTEDSSAQVVEQSATRKKDRTCFKKLNKRLKRQNKVLEEIRNLLISERTAANETSHVPKANTEGKTATSFFSRLGDAIIKAIPTVLTTVITATVSFFLRGNVGSQSRKAKGAPAWS